jgi:hypothetical protein
MAIRVDPVAAALEVEEDAAEVEEDALEVEPVDDDELELHPAISSAAAATATPPAAMRARLSLNMVSYRPPRKRGQRACARRISVRLSCSRP